jgi:hypothetical protein
MNRARQFSAHHALLCSCPLKPDSASCAHQSSPQEERARVEALDGGVVTAHRNGIHRLQGELAVSRSFGDFHLEPVRLGHTHAT